MRKRIWLIIALSASSAVLAGSAGSWTFEYRPFKGDYQIYGGSLGDTTEPTTYSRKIAYSVEGQVARQMFEAMGPDLKDVCDAEMASASGNARTWRASSAPITDTSAISASTW